MASERQPAGLVRRVFNRLRGRRGPGPDAERLARSGMFDVNYYEVQTGHQFRSVEEAAQHYLAQPMSAGLSPHPLFEAEYLDLGEIGGNPALRYLDDSELQQQSPHPVFSVLAARALLEVPVDSGVWLAWVRTAGADTVVPGTEPPIRWGRLRTALVEAARQWRTGASAGPATSPAEGAKQLSIIVVISGKLSTALKRVSLLSGDDEELVCAGFGSRAQLCCYTALAQTRPITLAWQSGTRTVRQWNHAAAAAAGERLVFVAPTARLRASDVTGLATALDDPRVAITQPLEERPDMTIHSAGAYFAPSDALPSPLLAEHACADAEDWGNPDLPAALSSVLAVRRDDFDTLQGFDPDLPVPLATTDLSLRAAASGLGATQLRADCRATIRASKPATADQAAHFRDRNPRPTAGGADLLKSAGFEVIGHTPGKAYGPELPRLARASAGITALPRLRWVIDTPATAGWWAQIWGDWHFATSLAEALRRLGQHVAVDPRQARERDTRRFDDVLLTLRGTAAVAPAGPAVSLLWVLYNAAEVTADETVGYDAVFAASTSWAERKSAEWGRPVLPLLQCTDPASFHPGRGEQPPNDRALFVGNTRRGVPRPIVEAALASGAPIDLYGTGWEEFPSAAGKVVARKVANSELGRLYAEAGLVLNDHREDMQRDGFVSNRLFDAVACGARVLSDPVPGAAEFFGDCVRFGTADQVGDLLSGDWQSHWPDLERRLSMAERVRSEHSFDHRATVLLEHAVRLLHEREDVPERA